MIGGCSESPNALCRKNCGETIHAKIKKGAPVSAPLLPLTFTLPYIASSYIATD
jgi:hypothetical protein